MATKDILSTKLSILIPVYKSESTIKRLVEELIENLGCIYELEIILVNDNSPDQSEEICISLFERYKNIVRFYSLSKNVGEHSAVMAGLNKVTGDYTVIMDDDFQNPISEIVKLVDSAMAGNHDVVYSFYDKKKHSIFRNLGSRFNNKVASFMLKKPQDLYLSSFKILNRFLINEIIKYTAPFPYIDGLILQTTDNIGRVKVEHHKRKEGSSGYTLRKLISLWLNMFTNFSIVPLRVAIVAGFIFAFLGLLFGIYTVIERLSDPTYPIGFAGMFVSISIFSGIQLVMLGMVGEYIGRIFISLNKKPQYTIRKTYEYRESDN